MRRYRHPQRRRQAGFSLLELMVALVAGLIAILAIYYMSSASSHHFHEQQRVSQAQMALRMAAQRIRRDVQLAGFTAVPNTSRAQTCQTTPGGLQLGAVEYLDNADVANLEQPGGNPNLVEADRLRLFGNFASGFKYLVRGVAGSTVTLQQNWQAFQASFGDPANYDAAAFESLFRAGRWVHIDNRRGMHLFSQITGVNGAARQFTIAPAPQNSCQVSHDAIITPLQRIEYAVSNEADPELATIFQNDALDVERGFGNSVLVRREVEFTAAGEPVEDTTQVVMEYVADLNYTFWVDRQAAPGLPPNLQHWGTPVDVAAGHAQFPGAPGLLARPPAGNPHQVRAVVMDISIRTADQEATFPFVARADRTAPLTRYQSNGTLPGASRVRSLRTEIALPNNYNAPR